MMSILGSRLRENSASVSTRCQSGSNPLRRNSRTISSASLGSSSTSKRRSGCETLSIHFRRLVQQQPIHSQLLHGGNEPLKVHRFDNVTVDSQPVAFDDILLFSRRGQHDYRNGFSARIAFNATQHFDPVNLWQFQIEQDYLRRVFNFTAGVDAFAEDELYRFSSIARDLDAIGYVRFSQRTHRQLQVLRRVFDN